MGGDVQCRITNQSLEGEHIFSLPCKAIRHEFAPYPLGKYSFRRGREREKRFKGEGLV